MSDEFSDVLEQFKAPFRRLLELRETRDADKAKSKRSEREYREAEAELFQQLRDAGVKGRLPFDFGELGHASFQLRSTKYGRIIDKDAATQAFEDEGLGDVIFDKSIREKRLNEYVRDKLESRAPLPEGVDFYERNGISISRR